MSDVRLSPCSKCGSLKKRYKKSAKPNVVSAICNECGHDTFTLPGVIHSAEISGTFEV